MAKEVAAFGITLTIVELGAARTSFDKGMIRAPSLAAYAGSPALQVQEAVAAHAFPIPGDAEKMARAMIDCVDAGGRPLRLPLGSDTYTLVRGALIERLAALDQAKTAAFSTDRDA